MAAVGALGLLPSIVFAGPIGRLCDSRHTSKVLIGSLIFRVLATLGIYWTQDFLAFVGLAAVRAAFMAATPLSINVIAVRRLGSLALGFFARQSLLANISKVLAPAIGAVLGSQYGDGRALMLAALMATLAIPAFSCVAIWYERAGAKQEAATSTRGSVPQCRQLFWMIGIYFAFVFMANNQLPLLLSVKGFDPSFFGGLVSASGLGNVIVGVWMSARSKTRRSINLMSLCIASVVQAVGLIFIASVLSSAYGVYYLMPIGFLVAGMASAYFAICTAGIISQRYQHCVGRVSAEVQRWQNTTMIVAPLVGAFVFDVTSAETLLFSAGALGLVATSLFAGVYLLQSAGQRDV